MKIFKMPSSLEVDKVDELAVKYFDAYLCAKGLGNWVTYKRLVHQEIGPGTRFIEHVESIVILDDGEIKPLDLSEDINLIRLMRRIEKRSREEKIQILITKRGEVKLTIV